MASHPGRNTDKMRIVSILTICMALCRETYGNISYDVRKRIIDSMLCLYSSSEQLALDLLNSDDRFLSTVSALLSLGRDVVSSSVYCPLQVIMAAFRQIRFDPQVKGFSTKTVMAWVTSDEIGAKTITAIVNHLIDKNNWWIPGASSYSPPTKRLCLRSTEYVEAWLTEEKPSFDDNVCVEVHVPFVDEQSGLHHEVALEFPRTAEIRKRFRSALPTAAADDSSDLEEMLVEVKLMITRKFLESEEVPAEISMLRDALSQFTSGVLDEDEDVEEYEEEEG
ncbi:hypothetical protein ANCCAN_09069 [Ancylostoma caninum]|uniref:Uncharacterized protein n=1 Tax=Ancylostoma caninum TaxID=29170 RepID=A0A368GKH0_ANCCA|nr:hypothetical protein ANCCAN_09069 [Ancylostoma caninum]